MLPRHRLHTWSCLACAIVLATMPATLRGQDSGGACNTGWLASYLHSNIVELMDDTDSEMAARRQMYGIPLVPEEEVRLVTDDALCTRAARAYYRHALGPRGRAGVAVVQVGDVYAVMGNLRAGEWTILTVFNHDWQELAGIAS